MSASTLFRHPHLTRGVIHTAAGNFVIERGVVRAPDWVGAEQGWQRVGTDTSDVVQTAMTYGPLDANGDAPCTGGRQLIHSRR